MATKTNIALGVGTVLVLALGGAGVYYIIKTAGTSPGGAAGGGESEGGGGGYSDLGGGGGEPSLYSGGSRGGGGGLPSYYAAPEDSSYALKPSESAQQNVQSIFDEAIVSREQKQAEIQQEADARVEQIKEGNKRMNKKDEKELKRRAKLEQERKILEERLANKNAKIENARLRKLLKSKKKPTAASNYLDRLKKKKETYTFGGPNGGGGATKHVQRQFAMALEKAVNFRQYDIADHLLSVRDDIAAGNLTEQEALEKIEEIRRSIIPIPPTESIVKSSLERQIRRLPELAPIVRSMDPNQKADFRSKLFRAEKIIRDFYIRPVFV